MASLQVGLTQQQNRRAVMIAPMFRRPHPKRHARPIAPQAHPLARQFFEIIERQGVALTDVAARAGLGVATLVKWK